MTTRVPQTDEDLKLRYALGDVRIDEAEALERQMARDPALAHEVERLRAALDLLPYAKVTTPPTGLRERILTAARERPRPARRAARRVPIGAWLAPMAAAASLAIVVLTVDDLRLRRELDLARATAEVFEQPNIVLRFAIRATAADGRAFGGVLLDLDAKRAAIVAHRLPALAQDEVYRLWAELEDGAVVPCGEFKPDERGSVGQQIAIPVDAYTSSIERLIVSLERGATVGRPAGPTVMVSS